MPAVARLLPGLRVVGVDARVLHLLLHLGAARLKSRALFGRHRVDASLHPRLEILGALFGREVFVGLFAGRATVVARGGVALSVGGVQIAQQGQANCGHKQGTIKSNFHESSFLVQLVQNVALLPLGALGLPAPQLEEGLAVSTRSGRIHLT